jgi:hypothetical protein
MRPRVNFCIGESVFGSGDTTIGMAVDPKISEAARLLVMQRKTHGHPPWKEFPCSWCGTTCLGRSALQAHEHGCPKRRGLTPVTDDDFGRWLDPAS